MEIWKVLPRDLQLLIIRKICNDIEMRISLKIINKLKVPQQLSKKLEKLSRPNTIVHHNYCISYVLIGCYALFYEQCNRTHYFYVCKKIDDHFHNVWKCMEYERNIYEDRGIMLISQMFHRLCFVKSRSFSG